MNYRGILHAHSTYSYDGKLSLAELKSLLQAEGVQFACMSEHTDELSAEAAAAFVAECRALSDERFIFVPGFEVPYQKAHILQFGCTTFFGQTADGALLKAWSAAAALTVLAHPVRNDFLLDEVMSEAVDGIEIWNQQYEGKHVPRMASVQLLRNLRSSQPALYATGGVDFHRPEHFGTPLTTMELATLSEPAICEALSQGRFSFGSPTLTIAATEQWQPNFSTQLQSMAAVGVIGSGKFVNKVLANLGVSLPTSWRQRIRKRL